MQILRRLGQIRLVRVSFFLLIAGVSLSTSAFALDPHKNIGQYGHEFWTSQNGPAGEAVYHILQSPEGYLWLRTSSGLVRFDGVQFVLVQPIVSGKPISEPVAAICLGAAGDLLVRTTTHTLIYKQGAFSDYRPPASLPDGAIRTLFESREHDVFVGSDDFIYVLRGGTPVMLRRHVGWVDSFYEDGSGTVWIFASSRLFTYRNGQLSVVPGDYGPVGFTLLAADRQQNAASRPAWTITWASRSIPANWTPSWKNTCFAARNVSQQPSRDTGENSTQQRGTLHSPFQSHTVFLYIHLRRCERENGSSAMD